MVELHRMACVIQPVNSHHSGATRVRYWYTRQTIGMSQQIASDNDVPLYGLEQAVNTGTHYTLLSFLVLGRQRPPVTRTIV